MAGCWQWLTLPGAVTISGCCHYHSHNCMAATKAVFFHSPPVLVVAPVALPLLCCWLIALVKADFFSNEAICIGFLLLRLAFPKETEFNDIFRWQQLKVVIFFSVRIKKNKKYRQVCTFSVINCMATVFFNKTFYLSR